jgi:hypothetical protein
MTPHQRQAAHVEARMIDFLIHYSPAEKLRVMDVLDIARSARNFAFEAFEQELKNERADTVD